MTPALLPAFQSHTHTGTSGPLILQSSAPGAFVHGMLVFGQSRHVRRRVHEHYRPHCKRVKVKVELDTLVPAQRNGNGGRELRRRSVWAHAWIWRDASSARLAPPPQVDGSNGGYRARRYDDYLATGVGSARSLSLRIEPAGWIEDDRETISSGDETDDRVGGERIEGKSWEVVEHGISGEWEEGSGGGAAVEWHGDEDFGPGWKVAEEQEADWEHDPNAGALDRDYDRRGNAGCW